LKLIDGLKLKGHPANIPDCSRDDLPELFKELGLKKGVEIGVYQGHFTEVLAKGGLEVYGVDPWRYYKGYGYNPEQKIHDNNYEITKKKLSKYPNVHLLRMTSMEAIEKFEDNSLDFVYIDGNHRFRYMAEDISEWCFKVKVGGIICGHDYAYFRHRFPGGGCQVREIVDAFVQSYNIANYWILGNRFAKKGEKRDRFRSWLIVKEKYE